MQTLTETANRFTLDSRPEDGETVPEETSPAISVSVKVIEPHSDVTYSYLNVAGYSTLQRWKATS